MVDLVALGLESDSYPVSLAQGELAFNIVDSVVGPTGNYQGRRKTLTYTIIDRARLASSPVSGGEKAGMLASFPTGDIPSNKLTGTFK